MEPLKPDQKQRILATNPLAAAADIEEYERLLAERFMVDPSTHARTPAGTAPSAASQARTAKDARLTELYNRLFPAGTRP